MLQRGQNNNGPTTVFGNMATLASTMRAIPLMWYE